jgi:hypothetical protein
MQAAACLSNISRTTPVGVSFLIAGAKINFNESSGIADSASAVHPQ